MVLMWRLLYGPLMTAYTAPPVRGFLVALAITRNHLLSVLAAAIVGFVGVIFTA